MLRFLLNRDNYTVKNHHNIVLPVLKDEKYKISSVSTEKMLLRPKNYVNTFENIAIVKISL